MSPVDAAWHIPESALADYVSGRSDPVTSASVESHVVGCSRCQAAVTLAVRGDQRAPADDATWLAITDSIDRPSRLGWLPSRLRWRHPLAMVVFGTPALRLEAALALCLVLIAPFALHLAGYSTLGLVVFLVAAPLVPLAGIAAVYRVSSDPAGELGLPTPARTLRLLLWRGAAVLGVSIPVGIVAAVLLDVPLTLVLGWILPALGLCAVTLATSTWRDPLPVAVSLAATWVLAVVTFTVANVRSADAIATLVAGHVGAIQIVSAVVCVAALAVFVVRRDAVEEVQYA